MLRPRKVFSALLEQRMRMLHIAISTMISRHQVMMISRHKVPHSLVKSEDKHLGC